MVPHRACVALTPLFINGCREQAPPLFLRCPSACRPLNDSRIYSCLLAGIGISPLPEVPASMSPTTFTKSPFFSGLHFVSYDRRWESFTHSQHMSGETAGQGPWDAAEGC